MIDAGHGPGTGFHLWELSDMHTLKSLGFAAALSCCVYAGAALAHGEEGHDAGAAADHAPYDARSAGTRTLALGGVTIRMLVEAGNLGSNAVEVGELFLPLAYGEGDAHQHGNLEIFYVVEGVLGHEVNGKVHRLQPGEVGFVKPGDEVRHAVLSEVPVKAVVIWVPGGEADALVEHAGFEVLPAD
jgi:quercetin dioxygenase-like cupin family protein